jgi:tetratricopeptide (TPR) repeat protein
MIVKDESLVITRCLESVKSLISSWVIVDTGSKDGTQKIIQECLKQIPGQLYERPWLNFAHNRNEALSLAKGKGDYTLLIDADETLSLSTDFVTFDPKLDCYLVPVQEEVHTSKRVFLIKDSLPWKWEGVVHECLVSDKLRVYGFIPGMSLISRTKEGARSKSGEKYKKDAEILKEALKKEPGNSRYAFYLAQSYYNSDQPDLALQAFQKRASMGGCPEETFWSLYQVALLQDRLQADPTTVIDSYSKAYLFRPTRAEPLYCLSNFYLKQNNPLLAYSVAKRALSIPMPNDSIFVIPWIYQYGIQETFAFCAQQMNKQSESQEASGQ